MKGENIMIKTIYSIDATPFIGDEGKYHYLYQITNLNNGKIYVGIHSTYNLNDGYAGSGKIIKRAIEKNGEENFIKEIKSFYPNRVELAKAENEIVNEQFIDDEETYNLVLGGGMRDRWQDPSFREFMIETIKENWKDEEYRKVHIEASKNNWVDPAIREPMIAARKKTINTPENKEKRSKQQKEVWQREDLREKSREGAKKQWADPEIREKMLNAMHSEEAKKKQSEGNKRAWQRKDYRENLSQKRKEMWQDPEIREKLMNNLFSEENRKHLGELASERFRGKPLSKEHKKKIGDAHRGKEVTAEQRERMSKAKKASTVGKIAILCLDENYNIIKKYNCMNDIYPDRGDGYRPVMKALRTCEPCKGVYYCREKDYEQFIAYKTGKSKEKPVIDINTKQSEKLKGQGCQPIYKIDQALNIVKEFDNVTKAMEDFPKSECTLHNYARNFTLCGDGFYYIKKKDYEKFIQFKQKEISSIEELF